MKKIKEFVSVQLAFEAACKAAWSSSEGRKWIFAGKANSYGNPECYTAIFALEGSPHKAVIVIRADGDSEAYVHLYNYRDAEPAQTFYAESKHPAPREIEESIAREPRPSWMQNSVSPVQSSSGAKSTDTLKSQRRN